MTESVWGMFPLELDSELIFLGVMIGIFICVIIIFISFFIKAQYFDDTKEMRRANKIRKHMRKFHPKV